MLKIWKSKLKHLSNKQYQILTKLFDFSGGQIDNIVRKADMHYIINGANPLFENIIEYCKTEKISKNNRNNIGFVA